MLKGQFSQSSQVMYAFGGILFSYVLKNILATYAFGGTLFSYRIYFYWFQLFYSQYINIICNLSVISQALKTLYSKILLRA